MRIIGRKGRRGGSALEAAFFLPWYIFLFVGAFDWGFYAHALISVENAARTAALYTSADPSNLARITGTDGGACKFVLEELRTETNIGSGVTSCASLPVIVTATKKAASGADGTDAAEVSVTYQTATLIPITGLLQGRATIQRVVQMKL
jgi:Flp pilus assembly protein TadG